MRDTTLLIASSYARKSDDSRLPVGACAVIVLGTSALSYWLLFHVIGALGLW